MDDIQTTISGPVARLATLWAAVGITSWAEAASFAAFCYSMILIGEWAWKAFLRDFAVRMGIIK